MPATAIVDQIKRRCGRTTLESMTSRLAWAQVSILAGYQPEGNLIIYLHGAAVSTTHVGDTLNIEELRPDALQRIYECPRRRRGDRLECREPTSTEHIGESESVICRQTAAATDERTLSRFLWGCW
ncbi:MAG: hypothetical protein H6643_02985 [Caldilineaceae bacterium]|nr:hypothetical protein [Caldilineaceae bacterium]